jgi:DNA-directed RNA polymerase specialized sigma24 family protein
LTATRDQLWWDELVERHSQRVWSRARGSGLNPLEAAEVCQLVWLVLADHLADIPTDDRIEPWLDAGADRAALVVLAGRTQRPAIPAEARLDLALRVAGD